MLKIRASSAGQIMTDPRSKSELLSETTKSTLQEIFIAEKYGRYKDFSSDAIVKGLTNEEQAITQFCFMHDLFLSKNIKHFENDFIKGTPDLITEDAVIDVKCSWDLFTFIKSDLTKNYEYQLLCYMELTGKKKATLAYVLTDTPENLIQNEVRRIMYQVKDANEQEVYEGLKKQMTYNDIPDQDKIRLFHIEYDQEKLDKLYARIILCRGYYESLTLTNLCFIQS